MAGMLPTVERRELTVALVQQVFPIALRDRRVNLPLFAPFVPADRWKDDQSFYSGLLQMINGDGIEALRAYDKRMRERKDFRKTFQDRAARFLMSRMTNDDNETPVPEGGAPQFHAGSDAWLIQDFLQRLTGESKDSGPIVPQVASPPPEEQPAAADWRDIARQLSEAALSLNTPDPELAARVLSLAEILVVACRSASDADAERKRQGQRVEMLYDRLRSLDPLLAEEWPPAFAAGWLDAVEAALTAVDARVSARAAAQAEFAQYDQELQVADRAGDDDAVEAALGRRRPARTRLAEADRAHADAMHALATLCNGPDAPAVEIACPEAPPVPDVILEPEVPRTEEISVASEITVAADAMPIVGEAAGMEPAPPASDSPEPVARLLLEETQPLAPMVIADVPCGNAAAEEGNIAANPEADQAVLAHYLENQELVFAWHFVRLVEDEDQSRAQPVPAAILYALLLLRGIRKAEDMAEQRRSGAMAEMMSALTGATERVAASRLALAALLRPALFDPDHGARGVLANLSREGELDGFMPLIEALSNLGHDARLSVQTLADLAGTESPSAEPDARNAVVSWAQWVQNRKTNYEPAHNLFHRELRPDGLLGKVVSAVASNAPNASQLVRDFRERLSNSRSAQEAWVTEARNTRRLRVWVEGAALDWLCSRLQEACDLLGEWLVARNQDAATPQNRNRDKLLSTIGAIRKALEHVPSVKIEGEAGLAVVAGRLLDGALEDLRGLLDGQPKLAAPVASRELFEVPLLRLPGGCQDWTDDGGAGYEEERAARSRRLLAALRSPECVNLDLASAFDARLAEKALLPAYHLLRLLRGDSPLESEDRLNTEFREKQQQVDEIRDDARHVARDRVERLRQSFTTFTYLILETSAELNEILIVLSAIAQALRADMKDSAVTLPALSGVRTPEVPPDFPELDTVLEALERRRDELRGMIASRQKESLERIIGPRAAAAKALLARMDRLDPVTVDDAIAELNAGRDVPLPEPETPDGFTAFFPDFVNKIEVAGENAAHRKILQALRKEVDVGQLGLMDLDRLRRGRLQQMLLAWGDTEEALTQPGKLQDCLTKLFGEIGLTKVSIDRDRELIRARLLSLELHCDVPRLSNRFMPPSFGSATNGRYRLLAVRDDVLLDQILRQIGSEAPDAAWIVLVFGRLNASFRRTLARRVRTEARQVLVLDETLLLYLCMHADDPLETLFTCAMPFSWVQPYTISPGQIPREVFFGRKAEIDSILSRDGGGCLVYGGRQLGKSALLNHIRGEWHQPNNGQLAIYLDIKPLGGVGVRSDKIWEELAHKLRSIQFFSELAAQPIAFVNAVSRWLDIHPARRIIIMFDEADNFLRAEHAEGYPNLLRLKNLMETTGRRFKVVFAGLHNVRRMAQAPNSPLPHLGEAICVGPMNLTAENRFALRRLAVEPMRAAGFEYADPALASDMLARMNYYPSLVQVFGRQIVENVSRRPPAGTDGPRWTLDRETLFEGEAAERIAAQIRERFQLTLNLDLRYECIAKSIALHRLDTAGGDTQVLAQGLTAEDIRKFTLWPRYLPQHSMAEFEELLREMIDLGVLGQFPGSRYGLRNAQIAQMLGHREMLEKNLLELHEREQEPSYDAGQFYGLLRPKMPDARAPLADRALEQLFDSGKLGLRIVIAPPAIVGADPAGRLKTAADIWFNCENALAKSHETDIRRALDRIGKDGRFLVIDGAWSNQTAALLERQDGMIRRKIVPIWCMPTLPADLPPDAQLFHAGIWTESMLRHWLANEGLAPALDDSQTRVEILKVSGGAPARLALLRPLLTDLVTRPVAERIVRLQDWARQTPIPREALALSADDVGILGVLAEYEDLIETWDELHEQCPGAVPEWLAQMKGIGCLREGLRPGHLPMLTELGRLFVPL